MVELNPRKKQIPFSDFKFKNDRILQFSLQFSFHNLYDLILTHSGPETVLYPPSRPPPSPSQPTYSFQNKTREPQA